MAELRVLLVDDDQVCREELRRSLSAFPYVVIAGEAGDVSSAVACLQSGRVDLVFLDIELGHDSGFALSRHIHAAFPSCKVVFLTGHVDFALEGYEYGPVDFLVKPANLLRLEQALLRAMELPGRTEEDVRIGIQTGTRLEIVSVRQILYLEKLGRQVRLALEGDTDIYSRETLQKLECAFLPHGFYRSHQSFLVPLNRIRGIDLDDSKRTYCLSLEGTNVRIPLSRDRFNELKELLSQSGLEIY